MRRVRAVDLFAGAGGTSTGLAHAMKALGRDVDLVAINHWSVAIDSHRASHPWAQHVCERVEAVDRTTIFPGERIDLLVASPECTHFSVARGGKPVEDQKRAGAWYVLDWVGDRRPNAVLLENVPEFAKWGRVEKGRPVKQSEGSIFTAYLRAFRALGYNVDWRVLNAADYGAVTTRRRLYVMAKRGRKPIHWPIPTHSKGGKTPGTRPWRAAREVLDFTLPSQSIFGRKRPLAQRTLDRIAKGIRKGPLGAQLEPLARAVEENQGPVPLVDVLGQDGMAAFQAWTLGQHGGAQLRPCTDPLATIAAGGAIRLVEALIVGAGGPERQGEPRSSGGPLPTILAESHLAVAESFILPPEGVHRGNAPRPLSDPLQTLTQRGGGHLAESAVILPHFGERDGQALRVHQTDVPMPTVHGSGCGSLAYLASYYGRGEAHGIEEPVPSLTTHDRHALVEAYLRDAVVDVRLRMLHPRELAMAMGFPAEYRFTGTRTQVVKQIGNAVEVNVARALCMALLTDAAGPVLPIHPEGHEHEVVA